MPPAGEGKEGEEGCMLHSSSGTGWQADGGTAGGQVADLEELQEALQQSGPCASKDVAPTARGKGKAAPPQPEPAQPCPLHSSSPPLPAGTAPACGAPAMPAAPRD